MRHKLFYARLQRTSSHRIALVKNLSKSLFEHKQITTTKPKATALISFVSRFITRLLKKTDPREAYRYINKHISGKENVSVKHVMAFYNANKSTEHKSHYLKKERVKIRSDNAIMIKVSLNDFLNTKSEKDN